MHYFLLLRKVPAIHNVRPNIRECAELFMLKQNALRPIGDQIHD
jgi:hypothetical protein